MLNKEIERRKKLFSDYGGDYQSYINNSKEDIESIVIVVHNYSAFAETYEEKEDAIAYLSREGIKYGIYFVVTALNTGAIRYRILQNFKQLFVLQLNDPTDYSGVLGNVEGVYPSKYKGRGIFKSDKVYEFQTAHISKKAENTFEFIRDYCQEYIKKWTDAPAKKIPILPKKIDKQYLLREINSSLDNKMPIGIEKNSLNTAYFDFDNLFINLILSQNNDKADFVQGLAEVMVAKGASEIFVIDSESMFQLDDDKKYSYLAEEVELDEAVLQMFNTLVSRNNAFKDAKELGEKPPVFDKITYIINSLSGLNTRLSADSKNKLSVLLEKGDKAYNVNIVISDSVSNISSVAYESWFKTQVSLSDGIWIGNGISDQYQLKISKMASDLYQEVGDSFGYTIVKGKAKLIKLLSSITGDSEVEVDG
jgi:S-DNA-T family DNA segregation ATPase FtsK/SpoIIIE